MDRRAPGYSHRRLVFEPGRPPAPSEPAQSLAAKLSRFRFPLNLCVSPRAGGAFSCAWRRFQAVRML